MPKILVVDDEPEVLAMIESHFSLRGYGVLSAKDGDEGLRICEAEEPEIVLLDLKMRRLDGDKFLSELRSRRLEARVIVITGFHDDLLRERIESLGIDAFLEKPASIVELQRKIESLVGAGR